MKTIYIFAVIFLLSFSSAQAKYMNISDTEDYGHIILLDDVCPAFGGHQFIAVRDERMIAAGCWTRKGEIIHAIDAKTMQKYTWGTKDFRKWDTERETKLRDKRGW